MQAWADDLARALKPRWGMAALLLAAVLTAAIWTSRVNSRGGY